jgi:hypothetical protein
MCGDCKEETEFRFMKDRNTETITTLTAKSVRAGTTKCIKEHGEKGKENNA